MSQSSDAYDGSCPECGHVFSLVDLARMAVGDGWERWICAKLADGSRRLVRFGEFNPATMAASPRNDGEALKAPTRSS
jgi:hypothetical protein